MTRLFQVDECLLLNFPNRSLEIVSARTTDLGHHFSNFIVGVTLSSVSDFSIAFETLSFQTFFFRSKSQKAWSSESKLGVTYTSGSLTTIPVWVLKSVLLHCYDGGPKVCCSIVLVFCAGEARSFFEFFNNTPWWSYSRTEWAYGGRRAPHFQYKVPFAMPK